MTRRFRNVLLFVGTVLGTGLLILGIIALNEGDPAAWRYIVGAVFAFTLALAPGQRLRNVIRPPDA
jgi:hypothetical protein